MRTSVWTDDPNALSTSSSQSRFPSQAALNISNSRVTCAVDPELNVFKLLSQREVCPQTKRLSKRRWREASKQCSSSLASRFEKEQDARRGLISWVESESLQHLSANYCALLPPPRSTIAAAFSPDGKTLASTHGDHTVKIIDCQTGRCLRVLRGHRRTPWVVRFHPINPAILASGSLDHEVRLWDANTAECIGSRDFYRPIASIAFHAHGEHLAVASGHKLYIWHNNGRWETSSPKVVLKTRRSLRAVHFHPHGAPFLLTAEVNDLDPSESPMTLATCPGYLCYPPPAVYMADACFSGCPTSADEPPLMTLPFLLWPSFARDYERISLQHTDGDVGASRTQERVDSCTSVRLLTFSTPSGQYELVLSPIEPNNSSSIPEEAVTDTLVNEMVNAIPETAVDTVEVQPEGRSNHMFPLGDPTYWELPLLQSWLFGHSQAAQHITGALNGSAHDNFAASGDMENVSTSSVISNNAGQTRLSVRSGSGHQSSRSCITSGTGTGSGSGSGSGSGERTASVNIPHSESGAQLVVSRFQSDFSTSLTSAAAAELPCTVKLRIWPHDIKDPCAHLEGKRCRLTIPHAVLCSEMGAHFSPCGRYLAACVACVLPHLEADPGLQSQAHHDVSGAGTSPTGHPISAHQVMYELRIYSLEEATFGLVLASRAIRAAHCLTSIQFSPTSEHLLLAYGRRHSSLLKSVVIDGEATIPIYTILEVYRISDMKLVRVLPSAEDEVNVACFHPSVGGGLVYGTKEGKLRILQCDGSFGMNHTVSSLFDESTLQVPTYALEC